MRRHFFFLGVLTVLLGALALASRENAVASRPPSGALQETQLSPNESPKSGRAPASIVIEPVTEDEALQPR